MLCTHHGAPSLHFPVALRACESGSRPGTWGLPEKSGGENSALRAGAVSQMLQQMRETTGLGT